MDEEKLAYDDKTAGRIMACNGWIMDDNPLQNFAHFPSQVQRNEISNLNWFHKIFKNFNSFLEKKIQLYLTISLLALPNVNPNN